MSIGCFVLWEEEEDKKCKNFHKGVLLDDKEMFIFTYRRDEEPLDRSYRSLQGQKWIGSTFRS